MRSVHSRDTKSIIPFFKGLVKKSDYRVGGLPVVCFTFREVQSLTALVQWWSFRRITSPAHLILLNLAYTAASLIFDCWRRVKLRIPTLT
ncbi:hypothetical protein Y032_0077g1126 [Ancylostoma ceylanicum]|uniref:Uncharacterized protein n=1 Tax=Ancylostoma ceylanicum TaxID=53326 RepID=A0A016TUH3_9BILA|nr:hypothetical protein Y032_0077g1126 [Ancylostoma ceylanicum]